MDYGRVKLTIRATPEQGRAVREAARALGMSANDFVLGRALAKATGDEEAARLSARLDAFESGLSEALEAFRCDIKADLADAFAEASAASTAAFKEQTDRTMKGLQSVVDYVRQVAEKRQVPQRQAEGQNA